MGHPNLGPLPGLILLVGQNMQLQEELADIPQEIIDRTIAALSTVAKKIHRQKTLEGLARARGEGRVGGRPRKLSPDGQKQLIAMLSAGKSIVAISIALNVSRPTVYGYIKRIAGAI